jgi:hypothetical protein
MADAWMDEKASCHTISPLTPPLPRRSFDCALPFRLQRFLSEHRTKAGAVTALQLSTATTEAHTWKMIAIVLGVVLAAVLIGAAIYLLRGTANTGGAPASSGGAGGTEMM